jgi:hypothetical protein
MDVLRGKVSRVRRSVEISGDHHGFSTDQILTFLIDGRSVELSLPYAPNIDDGDEVVVAGPVRRGTLHARAYNNLSNGSHGRWNYGIWDYLLLAPILCVVSAIVFAPLLIVVVVTYLWRFVTGLVPTFLAYRRVLGRAARTSGRRRPRPSDFDEEPEPEDEPAPVPAKAPPRPKPVAAPKPPPLPKPTSPPPPAPAPTAPKKVSVTCPKCSKRLQVSEETARTKFDCPNPSCDAVIDARRQVG